MNIDHPITFIIVRGRAALGTSLGKAFPPDHILPAELADGLSQIAPPGRTARRRQRPGGS